MSTILTSRLGTANSTLGQGLVLGPVLTSLPPDVLPAESPFDIYCAAVASLLPTYLGVTIIGSDTQFSTGPPPNLDLEIDSGGAFLPQEAALAVDIGVPEDFTLQFTAMWSALPANFNNIISEHSYFGTFSPASGCVGLFFSKVGIAYTGSVHFNASNSLVVDTSVQVLPGSQLFVGENEYWVVRVAMSFTTGAVYIYVTLLSELASIGHQLRYIMPAIPSSSAAVTPFEGSLVAVCGAVGAPTYLSLDELCLATGLLIPSIPPVASAGNDTSLLICSILQLNGSASLDPQDGTLTYFWRLLDAPSGSQFLVSCSDGLTYPGSPPTGFTDKLYSVTLGNLDSVSSIPAGNIVVVGGQPFSIMSTGVDASGFYVAVTLFELPDSLSTPTAFAYLLQNGLNTPTSEDPTFYPDALGIFKFDLTVYNGALYSLPSEVIVNVVENDIARGCVPDLTFLWNYLSDFWNLVDGTDRVAVFWQGLAQVAAAELLTLWQIDYSKSLRDIQRTFQRRWLHYDLLMQESPALTALSTVSAVYGGVESGDIPDAGIAGIFGTHLDLQFSTVSFPTVVNFGQPDPCLPVQIQSILQAALSQVNSNILVRAVSNHAGTITHLRIDAPFPFTVLSTSTLPIFTAGQTNGVPTGTAGAAIGQAAYLLDHSTQFLNIGLGDFLCINGVAYRISGTADVLSDEWPFQRVTLRDPLPTVAGSDWSISGIATSVDLDFWNGLCEQSDQVIFQIFNLSTRQLSLVTGTVLGSNAALTGSLPVDATSVGLYLSQPALYTVCLSSVLRRKYIPLDPLIVDIPLLQQYIINTDDSQVLRRNVDYFFTTFRGASCISFVTPVPLDAGGPDVWQGEPPPGMLWAETSYLDNRPRIEGNFGIPAGFTLDDLAQLPSNIDYLSTVQGLWYAYWHGPTMFNLRAGTQILLGLPFADVPGVITEVRDDFSVSTGLILVQDQANAAVVRSYSYPAALKLEVNPATGVPYVVGDTVQQFAPLVTGAVVQDYINNPDWFQGILEQGDFYEVQKYFTFLVEVSSLAFNLQALLFVQSFIKRIKPKYTYPFFVVQATVGDTDVSVSDEILPSGTLRLYDNTCFPWNGVATMFDQPDPNGGWRNQFDHNWNPATPPIYPNPNYPILWAFDKNYLCPEDHIVGTLCTTFGSSTLPTFDSIFSFDLPVYSADPASFYSGPALSVPAGPAGLPIGGAYTVVNTGTLTSVTMQLVCDFPGSPANYVLTLFKNGTPAATQAFTCGPAGMAFTRAISVAVTAGDTITVATVPSSGGPIAVSWTNILVETGQAIMWAFDTDLAAGTYCNIQVL